jgi:hypothetical protein
LCQFLHMQKTEIMKKLLDLSMSVDLYLKLTQF